VILNLTPTPVADTLTILPTYQCTAACKNCCFGSNPHIKHRIQREQILSAIKQAADYGIRLLVFSGGECFLLKHDLDDAIAYANNLGMLSRCVTNGYWAVTEDAAVARLRSLQCSGLTEINFSTGDEHQRFVPIERIINGILAALSLRMRCAVMVEIQRDRAFTKDCLLVNERLQQAIRDEVNRGIFSIVESPWMPVEPDADVPQAPELLVNADNVAARGRCSSVLSTFIVDPYGHVGACCGLTRHRIPEMMLGSLQENSLSNQIDEAFRDFMKIWLYTEGPEKILAWAASKDPSIQWENRYAHVCHA
jgi:hypothetical protein